MRIIYGRRLLTHTGSIDYPIITIADDGTIAEIESDPTVPATCQNTHTLSPTFLDIHTHGAIGYDIMSASHQAFQAIDRFMAIHGVGDYLPTTVTAPIDATVRTLEHLATEIERPTNAGHARPIGIHLEGPFLSHAKRGVHPVADILPPSIKLFDRFQRAARGHIRILTLAPEMPGAIELIRHAVGQGVLVSLGHTNATSSETEAAIAAGASSATHTFNAMRPIDHRAPGVLATVLDSDRLFAELICDGVHVAPELVRLWLRAKGPDLAMLVTDSMAATGMPDGTYSLGALEVAVARGRALLQADLDQGKETLAGSILTMDRAVANFQCMTGSSLATAIRVASTNPRRLLGIELAMIPGSPASFNRFDAAGTLIQTIIRGGPVN